MLTNSPHKDDKSPVDLLQKAMEQYGQYVELTKLTKIGPQENEGEGLEYRRTWDHPLGVVLTSQG